MSKLIVYSLRSFAHCLSLIVLLVNSPLNSVFAIESTASAETPKVTFPISELGNCTGKESCKEYCEDEANKETCIEYSRKKGFHKPKPKLVSAAMRLAARSELGCTTEQECKAACEKEENKEKCKKFAQKFNLTYKSQVASQLLAGAKNIVGCTSETSCRQFCSEEQNRQMCAMIAAIYGAKGGFKDEFCNKFPKECKSVKEIREASASGKLEKLSLVSEKYCQENPQKCGKPKEDSLTGQEATISSVKGLSTQSGLLQIIIDFLFSLKF